MREDIIQIISVSKKYPNAKNSWKMVRELLFERTKAGIDSESIWALKNTSFSVKKGEAFGIVGENGAGKSTLLSLIAGVIKPTSGTVTVSGTISSLLELGVGFHQEFTGIENIYLHGTILGLSRKEIDDKISSIIDFSELAHSIDRPLKTYSSGMVVRLAFSVAMAINPDILIVDEALSVGDIHFQKKSLDAILKFKQSGGTILFASHSMYHVLHLCDRALWLKHGESEKLDNSFAVVEAYENYMREKNKYASDIEKSTPVLDSPVWVTHAEIKKDGHRISAIHTGDNIELEIGLNSKGFIQIHIAVGLDRNDTVNVYATSTEMENLEPVTIKGNTTVFFSIYKHSLLAGEYNFVIILMDDKAFNVLYKYRTENFSVMRDTKELGIYKINHEWKINRT